MGGMTEIRAFVAIELDDAVREGLQRGQQELRTACARERLEIVRWVAPENIHLTVKFLGNVDTARLGALEGAVERAARASAPFELTARGVGCFPDPTYPNTVWVGLEGQVQEAARLARAVEDECAAAGFPRDERGFTPHLTLGRVKRERERRERAAVGELVMRMPTREWGMIRAGSLALIRSDLKPQGPVYTVLKRTRLGG